MRYQSRLAALAFPLALLMASCVGIDAEARIGTDGAVDLTLGYTVSDAVDELGRLGENTVSLPLPVGRADLELAATRAGGTMASWSRTDAEDSFTVKAVLRFPTPASFALFMDPAGELAVYAEAAGRRTLTLTMAQGKPPADPDFAAFLGTAFGSYAVSLRFRLPRAPLASSGLAVAGQLLSFSRPAAELYSSPDPVVISLSW